MTIDELVSFERSLVAKEARLRQTHRTYAAQQLALLLREFRRIRPILAERDFDAPLELAPAAVLPDPEPLPPPAEPRRKAPRGSAA